MIATHTRKGHEQLMRLGFSSFCPSLIRFRTLAFALVYPGILVLLVLLLRDGSDTGGEVQVPYECQIDGTRSEALTNSDEGCWDGIHSCYCNGAFFHQGDRRTPPWLAALRASSKHRILRTLLKLGPDSPLNGKTFADVALLMYRCGSVLTVGVDVQGKFLVSCSCQSRGLSVLHIIYCLWVHNLMLVPQACSF